MKLDTVKSVALEATKAVTRAVLFAVFLGGLALAANAILYFVVLGPAGQHTGNASGWIVVALMFLGAPLLFGWLGWMWSLSGSARSVVRRAAPDVSRMVFAKLETRLAGSALEERFDATGVTANGLIERLRAGVPWLSELPAPLRTLMRVARRVSDPIDQVANVVKAVGSHEVTAREVLQKAEGEFAGKLADFVPGIGAAHIGAAAIVNIAVPFLAKFLG